MNKLKTHPIFYPASGRVSYVLIDQATGFCAVIDPLLETSPTPGKLSTERADMIIDYLDNRKLTLQWILITHLNKEDKSAANYIQKKRGGQIGICEQYLRSLNGLTHQEQHDETQTTEFDERFSDGELFLLGHIQVEVLFTPGRSPFSVTYLAQNMAFVGDCLPSDNKGKRTPDRSELENHRLLSLPDSTQIFSSLLMKTDSQKGKRFECTVFELRRCILETI